MARRKKGGASSLAKLTRSVAKRKRAKPRANPAPKANPPIMEDIWEYIVPGVASYGAVRIAGRIAYKIGRKKSPGWAKHLGALVPAVVAAGAWFAVHRIPSARKYHNGVVVGSSIAAIQAIAQTYLPQWSWVLNDYHLDDVLPLAPQQPQAQPQGAQYQVPAGAYQPSYAPNYAPQAAAAQPQQQQAPPQQVAQPGVPQTPEQQAASIEAELDVAYPDPLNDNVDAWGMGADDMALDALERDLGFMN